MTELSPPHIPRNFKRIPSGPRPAPVPLRGSPSSSRVTSLASVHQSLPDPHRSSNQATTSESALDVLISSELDFTASPEDSPTLQPTSVSNVEYDVQTTPTAVPKAVPASVSQPKPHRVQGKTQIFAGLPMIRDGSRGSAPGRAQTLPNDQRASTPSSFIISRPTTPSGIASPASQKAKPKPSRLNTSNLNLSAGGIASPTKAISPGLKHWQNVRHHVMAPTPAEERAAQHPGRPNGKKLGLVSKAAGRFGFRQAADHVIGYDERRRSMMAMMSDLNGLSVEEQEEIARERRKFARDVKACLDACALEESRRRLWRVGSGRESKPGFAMDTKSSASSVHASVHTAQRFTFDPDFSAFAPLLTELHKHLPAARAKKSWSRTCPHHSAILAELGVAFLQDFTSTDGEKQQALEVFGVIVKSWAADSAEEELDRWLWLCRALLSGNAKLRTRGLALLASLLRADPLLPRGPYRPHTALAFISIASALLLLLDSVSSSSNGMDAHLQTINGLLFDLGEGSFIQVEETSLVDLLGSLETTGSLGGVEKELLWMAVASTAGDHPSFASWCLRDDDSILKRFRPSPILHATPPVILALRSRSTALFFSAWAALTQTLEGITTSTEVWRTVKAFLMSDITNLSDEDGTLATQHGIFLLELEAQYRRLDSTVQEGSVHPFRISVSPKQSSARYQEHREYLIHLLGQNNSLRRGLSAAAKHIVLTAPLATVSGIMRLWLEDKALLSLGKECVSALLQRFSSSSVSVEQARPFLSWLATAHPQILYKSLFSCSASTHAVSLKCHLQLVISLSQLVGPANFWTAADPQMVVIVLMGDVAPKQSKGKGKEGERITVPVKLGRYAVLVELIAALEQVEEPAGSGSRLRAFADAVEARLTVFLEAEEKEGALPDLYRALICQLLLKLRLMTMSVRRIPWIRLVLSWFVSATCSPIGGARRESDEQLLLLRAMYNGGGSQTNGTEPTPTTPPAFTHSKSPRSGGNDSSSTTHFIKKKRAIFDIRLEDITSVTLVIAHAGLTVNDWALLLPIAWGHYEPTRSTLKAVTFLLEKCAEAIPAHFRAVLVSDITSTHPTIRCQALSKMAMLFGWRYQVLAQRIITDRRGPVFHFTSRNLDFVASEIGSSTWAPPHDVQDAALQKFGPTLPLELRQRLMELGWSEDSSLQTKSDWEQIPVSALPSLQYQQEGLSNDRSPSPMRSLMRRGSSGSGSSVSTKRRKAIFAPILLGAITEQFTTLLDELDGCVSTLSRELVRLLQRDDYAGALRPTTDGFNGNFVHVLSQLNALAGTTLTPSFAHVALNSLVGFLKPTLRTKPEFEHYSLALTTIARVLPNVSEVSLRDVRKNKAEHVLLPASIHEDESGFKVHAPWRDARFCVQTAQLLILAEILKSNPRDVYLVKKMVSNLQIQGSIHHLPFARAWLSLITAMFSAVNRNYNDRAELRHFLANAGVILRMHGSRDMLIAAHAMRVFMLCSARFRRLFTSMGFATIMRPIYETYGAGNSALRDCVEYAVRSFYRIHQDTFVYQTCVVISEGEYDASAAYALLASLSITSTSTSGVASGVRGLNDQEEVEALVQMISGPELALSEIGQAAAERQASKLASISLDDKIFPKENIIRLFFTVIAANPATQRATNFFRLLADMVPYVQDAASRELLREGIEALGSVIVKEKTGDESATLAFHPGADNPASDWTAARRSYVFLVESYARAGGGHLGASATRRTLDIVLDLLRRQPESVGPAASSIVRELAKTHLASSRLKPTPFLRDIAPLFRMFIAVVDFSGVLDSITSLIAQSNYELDKETTTIIVDDYVEPAVKMLASASEDSMAFIISLRSSTVKLLCGAVFLKGGDALAVLERHPPNASLLASLVLPLCLLLDTPRDIDREMNYTSLWIRLLHYVIRQPERARNRASLGPTSKLSSSPPQKVVAATAVLVIQATKVIIIRAPESISQTKGLWTYIAHRMSRIIEHADGRFALPSNSARPVPRLIDWIMWTLFELLALHRSPLQIEMRCRTQLALQAMRTDEERSRPSSPALGMGKMSFGPSSGTPQMLGGRARVSSSRSPSMAYNHSRMPSGATPDIRGHSRQASAQMTLTPDHQGQSHSRMPSQHLSPLLAASRSPSGSGFHPGHGRFPSQGSFSGHLGGRPSFADLSARRASRPALTADSFSIPIGGHAGPGVNFRFPSSAGVKTLGTNAGERAGGAIVHLLNSSPSNFTNNQSSLPLSPGAGLSAHFTTNMIGSSGIDDLQTKALRDITVKSDRLAAMALKALRTVQMVAGYDVVTRHEHGNEPGLVEDDEAIKPWSVDDALHVIAEQTRHFVQEEFSQVFHPASTAEGTTTFNEKEKDWNDVNNNVLDPSFDLDGEKSGQHHRSDSSYSKLDSELPVFSHDRRSTFGHGRGNSFSKVTGYAVDPFDQDAVFRSNERAQPNLPVFAISSE